MEYTIEFRKSSVEDRRTMIHETTICETDTTTLKREVTKIAKTLEPFTELQKECPIPWDTHGYRESEAFYKKWTPYTNGYPLEGKQTYTISICRTAGKFKTAEEKVYAASNNLSKAYEALTNNNHAYRPDISKIDPEIAKIIGVDLPKNFEALMYLVESVQKRLQAKINELNEKE